MTTSSPAKPEYLGLLNRLSLSESRAGVYLGAWAAVTTHAGLKKALELVAAREATHGEVFRQRIERLGFSLIEDEDPKFEGLVRMFGDATLTDREKIRRSSGGEKKKKDAGSEEQQGESDVIAKLEAQTNDGSMDVLTRDTMRWYIAEERDTADVLRDAYRAVLASSD